MAGVTAPTRSRGPEYAPEGVPAWLWTAIEDKRQEEGVQAAGDPLDFLPMGKAAAVPVALAASMKSWSPRVWKMMGNVLDAPVEHTAKQMMRDRSTRLGWRLADKYKTESPGELAQILTERMDLPQPLQTYIGPSLRRGDQQHLNPRTQGFFNRDGSRVSGATDNMRGIPEVKVLTDEIRDPLGQLGVLSHEYQHAKEYKRYPMFKGKPEGHPRNIYGGYGLSPAEEREVWERMFRKFPEQKEKFPASPWMWIEGDAEAYMARNRAKYTAEQSLPAEAKQVLHSTGHFKEYDNFETEFLLRSLVKEALERGETVHPELLARFPDLLKR